MDLLRPDELAKLLESDGPGRVTIYQPAHRAGPDTRQDPIRFKNHLREAEHRLVAGGMRQAEAAEILQPARQLLEDQTFWQHQGDGLAVFCSRGTFAAYRLPLAFDDLVQVNERFNVKPLLPLYAADRPFYVLAVSLNETRILAGSRQQIRTMRPRSIPTSLTDALKYEESEKHLQWHSGSRDRGKGRREAVFHGHGAPDENDKGRILRYFRMIDRGLHELLREESAPLVLAGVEYYAPIYRQANTYPHLLEQTITGNPDRMDPAELHAEAWELVSAHYDAERADAREAVEQALGHQRGVANITHVLQMADQGRIDTLLIASDDTAWGRAEGSHVTRTEEPSGGDEDLLDKAAVQVLRYGGRVYPLERAQMPDRALVAASLRG